MILDSSSTITTDTDTLPAPPTEIVVPELAATPKKRGRPAKVAPPAESLFTAAMNREPFALRTDFDTAEGFDVTLSMAGGDAMRVVYTGPSDRLIPQALRQDAREVTVDIYRTNAADGADSLTLDAADVADALSYLAPAMSKDATRYNLCGLFIDSDGSWVATDGIRLHLVEGVGAVEGAPGAILPRHVVNTLAKALKTTKAPHLTMARHPADPAYIFFRLVGPCTRIEYRARLVDGSFPAYRQVLPTFDRDRAYGGIIDGRDVPAAITAAPVYLDKQGNKVSRLVFDQRLMVRAHDDSMSPLPFLYPFEWNQKGVPAFLATFDAVKFADLFDTLEGAVALAMADRLSPLVVRCGRKTGVIMPVRA